MGDIGNLPLQDIYYNVDKFQFTDAYTDFISHIVGHRHFPRFDHDFPVVIP
jgi:hypothetical protein